MTTTSYTVTGMTCGHCEMSVREEVSELPGVVDVQVSSKTGQLTVTSEPQVEDRAVIDAVNEAGYTAVRA